MKTLKFIIILSIIVLPMTGLYSQDCQSCRSDEYPYIGCCYVPPSSEWCQRCTNDPLSQTDDFKPFKKCSLNVTLIDYDMTGFPFNDGLEWSHPDISDDQRSIIDLRDTENDIYNALLDWILVCVPEREINEIDCDNCEKMKIFWARRESDMLGYEDYQSVTYQPVGVTGPPCRVDCEQSYIAINATNHFMDCDPEKGEKTEIDERCFFYTNKNTANKEDINWYHFRSVILHEIGHWLGLGDIKSSTCIPSGANTNSTVMWSTLGAMNERDELSYIDKCMFMLLYCCDPLIDVNDENEQMNLNLNVIPNPAANELIIKYNLAYHAYVNLYLFNNIGQVEEVISSNNIQTTGMHEMTITTDNLANGIYNLVLQVNDTKISKKVIIVK
ncbi:T9SS type A sorting domain-containing protein [Bacteroidota bacterium]